MKMMHTAILMAAVIGSSCDNADTYYRPISRPAPLLGDFESGLSVASVSNILAQGHYRTHVESGIYPEDGRRAPKVVVTQIGVRGYPFLGQTGTLAMDFFNDRLWATAFHATNPPSLLQSLHKECGIDFTATNVVQDSPFTEVNYISRSDTHAAVCWYDLRILTQLDRWQRKYDYIIMVLDRPTP